jgi:hypothetical protein
MTSVPISVLATLQGLVRSRAALHLTKSDRWLWTWLSRSWTAWRTALVIVKPETVIGWHRQGFRPLLELEKSQTRLLAFIRRCR